MTSWISIIKFNFLDSGFLGTTNSSTHHLVEKELLYLCALSLSHSSSHCPLYRPLLCECYKFECCYYSSSFAQIQICTNTNTKTTACTAGWMLQMLTVHLIISMKIGSISFLYKFSGDWRNCSCGENKLPSYGLWLCSSYLFVFACILLFSICFLIYVSISISWCVMCICRLKIFISIKCMSNSPY